MSKKLTIILLTVLILALALPNSSVAARKVVYKAVLSADAELHEVVDSVAKGSAVFTSAPDGSLNFMISVRYLSGPVTGIHMHGPATEAETAPVLITLCGAPGYAVVATCEVDATGYLTISGNISPTVLANSGITGRTLMEYLNGGLIYVNVHTELNPDGETRGQVYAR